MPLIKGNNNMLSFPTDSSSFIEVRKTLEHTVNLLHCEDFSSLEFVNEKLQRKSLSTLFLDCFKESTTIFHNDDFIELFRIIITDPNKPNIEKIKGIFFNKISRLKQSQKIIKLLYDKGILNEDFQNILSPELKRAREAFKITPSPNNDLDLRIAQATLAIHLGVGKQDNTGTTGTLILSDLTGKKRGIFKLDNNHISWWIWVISFFKKTFWGQLKYLKNDEVNAQSKTEVAAYRASNHFNFHLVPPSKLTTINNENGVFMKFLTDYEEAGVSYIKKLERQPNSYTSDEINEFQKLGIFHYLIGHLDGHGGNWMVHTLNGQTTIKAIDNANSFPKTNPSSNTSCRNQYQWRSLKIANEAISEKTKELVHIELTDEKVNSYIDEISNLQFLNADMRRLFLERVSVIRRAIETPYMTLNQLGKVVSDGERAAFLLKSE